MAYTGKKHVNYIWIPKAKSDLKEYRDFLKIADNLEVKNGYFNDISMGLTLVKQGGIFDGSLGSEEYIKKYSSKTVGNQSYVSNARMTIRMCRFFGWITRDPKREARFYLTERGKLFKGFYGKFPYIQNKLSELDLMLNDIVSMRFYSVNDNPEYQNRNFKQRPVLYILYFLNKFDFMHNFEIVCSALSLKNEKNDEIKLATKRIEDLRNGVLNISELLTTLNINPDDRSSLTGVYDGPKVLCSFMVQLGLVRKNRALNVEQKAYYNATHKGSPYIKEIHNIFEITGYGKTVLQAYIKRYPLWFDDFPEKQASKYSTFVIAEKAGLKNYESVITPQTESDFIRRYTNNHQIKDVDFEAYRDIPPENYEEVINILKTIDPKLTSVKIVASTTMHRYYIPKIKKSDYDCCKCLPPLCSIYIDKIDVSNSSDYNATAVCPVDAIVYENKKIMIKDKCVDCCLCVYQCPFNAIRVENKRIYVSDISNIKEYSAFESIDEQMIAAMISKFISSEKLEKHHLIDNRIDIVMHFEEKISKAQNNWHQLEFYTWVRNCLKSLGLDARYTGGEGMKTRSDVTVYSPLKLAIEIKSPGEGKVTGKAIRQAFDASVQLNATDTNKEFSPVCIGQSISSEACRKADQYKKGLRINIPLVPSKVLMYLFLINSKTAFTIREIAHFFKEIHGEITATCLVDYLMRINELRQKEKRFDATLFKTEIEKIFK